MAYDRRIAAIFIVSAIAAFGVLRLVADGIRWLARRAPRVRSTALRLALGNIHRPGALTPSVVLSLGLGLTLMVAIALIDGNLRRQVTENIPAQAPDFSSSISRTETSAISPGWSAASSPTASSPPARCCADASWPSTAAMCAT